MQSTSSRAPVWCLVDCNNFYASCEQIFRPDLAGRPVVVLSNNDGCIIARNREAKAIGVPMGEAWFKIRSLLEEHSAAVFSANFALYGDISARIMAILEKLCPKCEQYSIDEAFLQLDSPVRIPEFCRSLRETVRKWTGITVSVGVGQTPTLAKLANHIAKADPRFEGVFSLLLEEGAIDKYLEETPVQEIWGIGRRHAKKLNAYGVRNALQFKKCDDAWLRREFTITGLRCAWELRGKVCETTWENPDWKRKTMLHSRSFGNRVRGVDELSQAIASFCCRLAERLRAMNLLAGGIWLRARTSVFDGDYNACSGSVRLGQPTADSGVLVRNALKILRKVYVPGYPYAKAGVMFFDLESANNRQPGLFEANTAKSDSLMAALDKINDRYGKLTLRYGAAGLNRAEWHMRQERRSPGYTTSWQELPQARC